MMNLQAGKQATGRCPAHGANARRSDHSNVTRICLSPETATQQLHDPDMIGHELRGSQDGACTVLVEHPCCRLTSTLVRKACHATSTKEPPNASTDTMGSCRNRSI